ncbi:hypothetical protein HMPREF9443_01009 [Phascolarctobacterium succinatutens YIT 12067]|uniref:Uncharacterized protein n=1 Tax=Phascolarctobacterium succinatutens YIT 12067 TaxID=626939 RepID=E8LDT2_9FIRM|nr:hypothetical protein HMPREF9443_01009 [Phascolarctobacterium succinatutens YIT 12067]
MGPASSRSQAKQPFKTSKTANKLLFVAVSDAKLNFILLTRD